MKQMSLKAEMMGVITELVLKPGDAVKAGDTILFLQSMKMEIPLYATIAGKIREIPVAVDQAVQEGDDLAIIDLDQS